MLIHLKASDKGAVFTAKPKGDKGRVCYQGPERNGALAHIYLKEGSLGPRTHLVAMSLVSKCLFIMEPSKCVLCPIKSNLLYQERPSRSPKIVPSLPLPT